MKKRLLQRKNHLRTLFMLLFMGATALTIHAQDVVLNFSNMNPHLDQKLEARLLDKSNMREVSRVTLDKIATAAFSITLTGEIGKSYFIDFYADLNKNGRYNAPPVDHAWRLEANNLVAGDNMLNFIHNTSFTDIQWRGLLKVEFKNMNPHIGQKLELRLRDLGQNMEEVGRVSVASIAAAEFVVNMPFLQDGHTYWLDFYADLNKNGTYDAPPVDHAWRLNVTDVEGDEDVTFLHNTIFTDIQFTTTAAREISTLKGLNIYPNPVNDFVILTIDLSESTTLQATLYNNAGQVLQTFPQQTFLAGQHQLPFENLNKFQAGIYLLKLQSNEGAVVTLKLTKK